MQSDVTSHSLTKINGCLVDVIIRSSLWSVVCMGSLRTGRKMTKRQYKLWTDKSTEGHQGNHLLAVIPSLKKANLTLLNFLIELLLPN